MFAIDHAMNKFQQEASLIYRQFHEHLNSHTETERKDVISLVLTCSMVFFNIRVSRLEILVAAGNDKL